MKFILGSMAVLLLVLASASTVVAVTPSPSGYTFYLIQISVVNTSVTYRWTNTNTCGTFTPGGQSQPDSATWNFTAGLGMPCTGSSGPAGTITAVMTDSESESITCTYPNGSASFNGSAATNCNAVSTPNFNAQPTRRGFHIDGVLAYQVLSTTSTSTTTTSTTAKSPTTTVVACSPKNITVSVQSKCVAQVIGNGPTGLVQWSYTSSGGGSIVFPPPYNVKTCALANGACFVMVQGNNTGSVTIKALYQGDSNNLPSGGSTSLGITAAASTSSSSSTQASSSSTAGGGIPEFPFQLTIAAALTAIIVLGYVFVRNRTARAARA